MDAEPSESQWPPSATIRTLWKLLWHIDVKKDHKGDYDEEIVNSILPNPDMEVDLPDYRSDTGDIVAEGISAQGSPSKIPVIDGKEKGKDWLMNYIIRRDDGVPFYPNIFNDGIAEGKTDGALNIRQLTSYPLGKRYEVHVVPVPSNDHPRQAEIIQEIQEFFQTQGEQTPMYVYFDTGADLEDFLPKLEVVFDAYTRASESDPAGKPNFGSTKVPAMKPKILYELPQPTGLTYDAYNEVNPHALSQFYCKYPVTLMSEGKRKKQGYFEKENYHIDVKMTYIKDETLIKVIEGGNKACAFTKQKIQQEEAYQKEGYDRSESDKNKKEMTFIKKEMTFISKHHGDIGQVLDKDRQILLKGWLDYDKTGLAPIDTAGGRHCFVSYDQIAITKSFTTGADYTMFFKLETDKERIVLIRPLTVNPEAEFEYVKKQIVSNCNEIAVRINEYNNALPEFRTRLPKLLARLGDLFKLPPPENRYNPSNIYTYVVRKGAQIASILDCIYSGPPENIQPILLPVLEDGTLADPTNIQFTGNILADKKELYRIESLFIRAERMMLCPINHVKFNPFDGETIKPSDVETVLLLKYGGGRKNVTQNKIKNQKKKKNAVEAEVNSIWKTIHLDIDPKRILIRESVLCRVVPKHTGFWCLDLVSQCHTLMNNWNNNLAKIYLLALNNAVNRAYVTTNIRHIPQTWFDARTHIGLSNIPTRNEIDVAFIPPNAPAAGGRQLIVNRQSELFNEPLPQYNKTIKNLRKPNTRLTMKASPVNKLNSSVEYQLNLIEQEVKEIGAVITFYTDILDLTDKQEIQELHDRFFNTIYYKDTLTGGGQSVPILTNPGKKLDIMIDNDTGEKLNIFMTVPPMPYYELSVEQLNILLERLKTLRSDNTRRERISVISADLERVREKINQLYNREIESEKEDANRPDSVEAPEVFAEDEIMELNENIVSQNITEQLPPQNTNANTRKTLKRPRNNNNNNQQYFKRPRNSNRKSRYMNNKTYRKK